MTPPAPFTAFHRANALTYASLIAAVAALAAAAGGHAPAAGALVALAVVADTFDGLFARRFARTEREQSFGVQLDSLSDAIAFGIAPSLCVVLLAPPPAAPWVAIGWWLACATSAACAITRLAFYNVTRGSAHGFIGLPVPVAALIWSSVLLLEPDRGASAVVMLLTAAAMVAPLRLPRPTGVALGVFVLWPLAVILLHALR